MDAPDGRLTGHGEGWLDMKDRDHVAERCYLVSCVSAKRKAPSKAKDLYISAWFKKARCYVEGTGCPWFILSAEHGLVHPESVIAPYEKTLNAMHVDQRRQWAARVIHQMKSALPPADSIVVFAGAKYREFITEHLRSRFSEVLFPLEGLRIGEQLSWFSHNKKGPQIGSH